MITWSALAKHIERHLALYPEASDLPADILVGCKFIKIEALNDVMDCEYNAQVPEIQLASFR